MNKIVLRKSFILLILFFFINCDNEIKVDYDEDFDIKPYDPIKAGAEIVVSYDLTDAFIYYYNCFYHLDEYLNKFYILHNEKLAIYDKNSMIKNNEIFFDKMLFCPEYDDKSDFFYSSGLSVFNNKIFLSFCYDLKSKGITKYTFFDMDLSGDNLREFDISSDLNFNSIPLTKYGKININYNNIKEQLWIKINDYDIYEYKVNGNVYEKINYYQSQELWFNVHFINGDFFWNSYQQYDSPPEIYIEKRNLLNQNNILLRINTTYLGTNSNPHDLLYDGIFLWVIIYKDGKIQLLKLRPL